MKRILGGLLLAGLLACLQACGGDSDSPSANIVQAADAQGLTALTAAVQAAGLTSTLEDGDAHFTVFAPTDAAFEAAASQLGFSSGAAMIATLPPATLASLLEYHVLGEQESADMLSRMDTAPTLYSVAGTPAALAIDSTDGVAITDADLTTAHVTEADIPASNGVLHVVDKLLVPPGLFDVVQMARLNPDFTQLVGALQATGLDTALSGAGPFTVFAPTDDAFGAIESTIASLDDAQLATVLAYHVVGTAVPAADIPFGQPIATLANQTITITAGTPPTIADTTDVPADIVATDVRASNGLIHVIDKVLIPTL